MLQEADEAVLHILGAFAREHILLRVGALTSDGPPA